MSAHPDAPLVMRRSEVVELVARARAHGYKGYSVDVDYTGDMGGARSMDYAERVVPQATAREREWPSYTSAGGWRIEYRRGKPSPWYAVHGSAVAWAPGLDVLDAGVLTDDDLAACLALRDAAEPEDAVVAAIKNALGIAWNDAYLGTLAAEIRALIAAESPTRTAAEAPDGDWPAYLMIRDTKLNDDQGGQGQRIFTTAGSFYEKMKYVRADLVEAKKFTAADHVAALGWEKRVAWVLPSGSISARGDDDTTRAENATRAHTTWTLRPILIAPTREET